LVMVFTTVALGATEAPDGGPAYDFSPAIFFAAMIVICVCLFLVAAGIVAGIIFGVVAVASATLLSALGIVSSSALIGIFRRRFSSGLRAFHYQICAVAALPAGMGVVALGERFLHAGIPIREVLVVGGVAGACAGLILAFAFDVLARIGYHHLTDLVASGQRKALAFPARI